MRFEGRCQGDISESTGVVQNAGVSAVDSLLQALNERIRVYEPIMELFGFPL